MRPARLEWTGRPCAIGRSATTALVSTALPTRGHGRPPRLSPEEKSELVAIVPNPEVSGISAFTRKDLVRGCQERFGNSLYVTSMGRIPRELGLSRQKARPSHPQKEPAAQAAFKMSPALLRQFQRTHRRQAHSPVFPRRSADGQKGRACRSAGNAASARQACAISA
jgi:transposase